MANAAEEALEGPMPTFERNGTVDDKDMALLRPEAAAMALAGMGVLDHESPADAPTNSEHWPIMVELNTDSIMGIDEEQVIHPKKRMMGTVLRAASSEEVKKKYADGIFNHLKLAVSVSELEKTAKVLAGQLGRGVEVSK